MKRFSKSEDAKSIIGRILGYGSDRRKWTVKQRRNVYVVITDTTRQLLLLTEGYYPPENDNEGSSEV